MRLIDADELTTLYGDDDALRVSVAVVKQNIADMPTINAEPKHAYVIVDEDGNIECSNCGSSNCFDNYCGNCGAKLIGTRKGDEEND